MYILDDHLLQLGDIILQRDDSIESLLIRKQSGSEYSHAQLFVEGPSVIDSNFEGVQAHNPRRHLYEQLDDVMVLRAKEATDLQLLKIEQFARSKIGTTYSLAEVRKSLNGNVTKADPNRQFCTRFVAQSYEYGGISIVEHPDYCTPANIEQSSSLQIVPNVVKVATEKEIAHAKEGNVALNKQTQIHNEVLKEVRALSGQDIQTFEQVEEYAGSHPEMADALIAVLTISGYLDMWRGDVEKNPWDYSFEAFSKYYPEQQWKTLIEHIEKSEEAMFRRFKPMHEYFLEKYTATGNKFFKTMMELYEKLLELNEQRLTVAIDARIEIGYLAEWM